MMIQDSDIDLMLLHGVPILIKGVGEIYPPTLSQIVKLGESEYNRILSHFLIDKSNVDKLSDPEISNIDILMSQSYHYPEFKQTVIKGFELFFQRDCFVTDDGVFYFVEIKGETADIKVVSKEGFEEIQHVLKKANNIKVEVEPEYNPGNERARKFIENLKKNKKNKPVPKQTINLHSMISGLAWKSNGVNIFDVFNLTIYQLHDAFSRLENIDNYNFTLTGIYAGTIDGKKINLNNINWAKIMNLKEE